MKRLVYLGISLLLLSFAVSCDQLIGPDNGQTGGSKEVKLSAGLNAYTKATDTAFENGDEIGVSIIVNGDYEIDNAKFTMTGGELVPDQTYYWYEDESLKSTVYAYYPYASGLTGIYNASGFGFTVCPDQSTHYHYTQADLMMAKVDDVTPTESAVHLAFDHMLSKIVISIDNQLDENIKDVYVSDVYTSVNINPITFEMETAGSKGSIKAGKLAVKGNESWALIVVPQTDVLPKITIVTESGEVITYSLVEAVSFASSKEYPAEVVLAGNNDIKVDFSAEIYDWKDGEDMYFEREGDEEDVPVVPPSIFKETDTWAITYLGRVENGEGDKMEAYDVKTNRDSLLYYVSSYPAYLVTEQGHEVYEMASSIAGTLEYYFQQGGEPLDILSAGSKIWYESRLESGDYYVLAVGFNQDGTPTYEYSVAEITIAEEEATADYLKWIGTWNMTSSAGVLSLGGESVEVPSVTYVVTIDNYDTNYMYAVKGWETEGAPMVDLSQYYAPEDLMFPAYFTDGQLEIREYDMFLTADSATATSATHYFGIYGYGDFTDGSETFSIPLGFSAYGFPMAVTSTDGDKTVLDGCTIAEEGMSITYRAMGYMEMPLTANGYVMLYNYPVFFPITMEKVGDVKGMTSTRVSSFEPVRFKKDLAHGTKKLEPRVMKLVKGTF